MDIKTGNSPSLYIHMHKCLDQADVADYSLDEQMVARWAGSIPASVCGYRDFGNIDS